MKKNILFLLTCIITIAVNAQQESNPQIKEIYFVDRSGEKIIGSVTIDEKIVYMIIVTANAKGENLIITMDEEDGDYFYKNKFLEKGSSIDILIKKDIQKVKLVIYNGGIKKHVKRRTGKKNVTSVENAIEQ